jgi:hypothetical protein
MVIGFMFSASSRGHMDEHDDNKSTAVATDGKRAAAEVLSRGEHAIRCGEPTGPRRPDKPIVQKSRYIR